MRYIKSTIILIAIFHLLFSCRNEIQKEKTNLNRNDTITAEKRELSLKFNNEAMNIYAELLFEKDSLQKNQNKIISLLDKAIANNPVNELTYSNKANVLIKCGNYNEAKKVLKKARNLNNNNEHFMLTSAFIYEKTGDIKEANHYYKQAIRVYDEKLKNKPNDISYVTGRIFVQTFTVGKEFALNEIVKLNENKPDNQFLIKMKEMISKFNRKEYIDNL